MGVTLAIGFELSQTARESGQSPAPIVITAKQELIALAECEKRVDRRVGRDLSDSEFSLPPRWWILLMAGAILLNALLAAWPKPARTRLIGASVAAPLLQDLASSRRPPQAAPLNVTRILTLR